VFEADDPSVKIEILEEGRVARVVDLKTEQSIDLTAGEYGLQLADDSGADWSLSTDTLTITRGGKKIVEVRYEPSSIASAGSGLAEDASSAPRAPTYDGKTLAEWFAELETERNPEHLIKAVHALDALSDEASAGKAARCILSLMRTHGALAIDDTARGKLINASRQVLWQLPADAVIPAILEEIADGNDRSREFLTWMAIYPSLDTGYDMPRAEILAGDMKNRIGEITSAALALLGDESVSTRKWALGFIVQFCNTHGIDPEKVEGLIPRCREALSSPDLSTVLMVSDVLVKSAPDTEGLADALTRALSDKEARNQYSAIQVLRQLGPRAGAAVPTLVNLLTEYMKPSPGTASQPFGTPRWGVWMGGGGIMQDLRVEIIQTLGAIGPGAAAALPLLERVAAMKPSETGRTDFDDLAKKAIAKIKATGQEEEKIVDVGHEPSEPAPGTRGTVKAPSPVSQASTYDGKTVDQWCIELETERNLERVTEAVRASAAFPDEASAEKTTRAIFSMMRWHGSFTGGGADGRKLLEASREALWRMPPDAVVSAMLEEITNGNDKSRAFMNFLNVRLMPQTRSRTRDPRADALAREMKKRAGEITSAILTVSRDGSVTTRKSALEFVARFCSCHEIDPTEVEGLIPRCREELSSRDLSVLLPASDVLVTCAPDTAGLVDALIDVLSDEDAGYHHSTVRNLAQLGPRAAPAVPELVDLLSKCFEGPPGRETLFVPPTGNHMVPTTLRVEIINALGAIGPDAAAALPLLEKLATMEPSETGRTDFDDLAKKAIAKIRGAGQDEQMSVETGHEPSKPAPSTSDPAKVPSPAPQGTTYDGKTLDQWYTELETERNLERLAQAVRAIGELADDASGGKAVRAIFSLIRIHGSGDIYETVGGKRVETADRRFVETPGGKVVSASRQALCQMPADALIPAMLEEVANGNDNSREFLPRLSNSLRVNATDRGGRTQRAEAVAREMKDRADEIAAAALALSRHDSVARRKAALGLAAVFAHWSETDPTAIDGLIERFQEELSNRDVSTIVVVAYTLIEHAPDTEGLVDSLIHVWSNEDTTNNLHFEIFRCFQRLGPRAAPAVPKLVTLLTEYMESSPNDGTPLDGRPKSGVVGLFHLRVEIIDTLGAIGPDAAAALPLLEEIVSMNPTETSRAGLVVKAREAIAKIKATGKDEEKSVETPQEPKVSTGEVSPIFKPPTGGPRVSTGEVSPLFRPRSAPSTSRGSAY